MVDFPSNPLVGDKHYEEGQVWTYVDPGAWSVGEGLSGTTQIVDSGSQYVVMGNTLIQWGTFSTASDGRGVITYPKGFAAVPICVTDAYWGAANTNTTFNTTGETVTGTEVFAVDNSTGAPLEFGTNGRWIAIGIAKPEDAMPDRVGGSIFSDMFLDKQTTDSQEVNGTVQFNSDTRTFRSSFLQRYAPDDGWTGLGWANSTGFTYWYLGMEPTTNRQVLERYDGAGNFLGNAYTIDHATGTINFELNVGVGEDIYFNRSGSSKNETGVIWQRDNTNTGAYLFWNESSDQLQINTYNSSGQYTGTPMEIYSDATFVKVNSLLEVNGNTIRINENTGVNSHLYFQHNGLNHALFYSTPSSDAGLLNVNQYNNAGTFLSQGRFYYSGGMSRSEFGDMVCTTGRYYGPQANFGASIQNTLGGVTSFGDLGFHRLVGGGGGPVGVYLELNNNGNISAWGVNMDFTSDPSTKTAVQPSPIDALADVKTLAPIQWQYNDKVPRLKQYADYDAARGNRLPEVEFNNAPPVEAGPVDVPHTIDDTPQIVKLGFTSEDIKRIAPEAVYECDGLERIDYRLLVPHCLKAIQQLTERLEALENGQT